MHKRIANLDLFRFLAIILVIYFHVSQQFLISYYPDTRFVFMGRYGVEMFFVLSGFLIGGLYYKNANKISLLKFWLQRFLRTYPPYIVALFVSFLSVFIFKKEEFNFGYLFFLQNFYHEIPFFKVSWSLCVEEHFYLLFPFIIMLTRKITEKNVILFVWILICLLPTLLRLTVGDFTNQKHGFYTTATIFRFDGIALGCLIAYILNNYTIALKSNAFINIFLITSLICLAYWHINTTTLFKYTIGYFFLILNVALLLVSFYFSKDLYIAKRYIVKKIALMAYSLYLTHALIINVFEMFFKKYKSINIFVISLICFSAIILTGYIFYLFVEKPSIDLRKKLLN